MPLCDTCQNVPWHAVPAFPEQDYGLTIPGLKHTHPFRRSRDAATNSSNPNPAFAVRHHSDLQSLERSSSESRCDICRLILRQVREMLEELDAWEFKDQLYVRPSMQDTWICRRPGDLSGFWVMSDCAPSANKEWIVPVAAFTKWYLPLDHSLPLEPSRSEVRRHYTHGTSTAASSAYDRFGSWTLSCAADHDVSKCQVLHRTPPPTLVALGSAEDSCVKLVQPGRLPPSSFWYAALSYRADSREIARLWDDQLQVEDVVLLSILPQLFQDAIHAARGMRMPYVWIDSLCASAGCARDAKEVADAFANAKITISATACKDTSGNLFSENPATFRIALQDRQEDTSRRDILLGRLPLAKETSRRMYVEMADEPISQSVWAFQERVFSRQVAHFATDQLYFECISSFVSEDGLEERMRYHTVVDELPEGTESYRPKAYVDTPLSRWASIMFDYGKREAAGAEDKVLAISNVARAFQDLVGDEYVAGHWKKTLPETLCWAGQRPRKIAGFVPSWSWLSIQGVPSVRPRDAMGEGTKVTELAALEDIKVVLADSGNPYGCVTEATISLEAPVVPVEQFQAQGYRGKPLFKARAVGGREDGFIPSFDDQVSSDTDPGDFPGLVAIIILEIDRQSCTGRTCLPSQTLRGLLATPVDGDAVRFRRVGAFGTTSKNFEHLTLSNQRRSIILM